MDESSDASDADAEAPDEAVDTRHLDGVEDGCGCTEIWEHLSESRAAAAAEGSD